LIFTRNGPTKRGEVFLAGQVRGIDERRLDVFRLERWVLRADLARREAIGKVGEHHGDHDPRTADACLAMADRWIDQDPIQKRLPR
jgi:hypothetical protein